jgi:hypothetical protein
MDIYQQQLQQARPLRIHSIRIRLIGARFQGIAKHPIMGLRNCGDGYFICPDARAKPRDSLLNNVRRAA